MVYKNGYERSSQNDSGSGDCSQNKKDEPIIVQLSISAKGDNEFWVQKEVRDRPLEQNTRNEDEIQYGPSRLYEDQDQYQKPRNLLEELQTKVVNDLEQCPLTNKPRFSNPKPAQKWLPPEPISKQGRISRITKQKSTTDRVKPKQKSTNYPCPPKLAKQCAPRRTEQHVSPNRSPTRNVSKDGFSFQFPELSLPLGALYGRYSPPRLQIGSPNLPSLPNRPPVTLGFEPPAIPHNLPLILGVLGLVGTVAGLLIWWRKRKKKKKKKEEGGKGDESSRQEASVTTSCCPVPPCGHFRSGDCNSRLATRGLCPSVCTTNACSAPRDLSSRGCGVPRPSPRSPSCIKRVFAGDQTLSDRAGNQCTQLSHISKPCGYSVPSTREVLRRTTPRCPRLPAHPPVYPRVSTGPSCRLSEWRSWAAPGRPSVTKKGYSPVMLQYSPGFSSLPQGYSPTMSAGYSQTVSPYHSPRLACRHDSTTGHTGLTSPRPRDPPCQSSASGRRRASASLAYACHAQV